MYEKGSPDAVAALTPPSGVRSLQLRDGGRSLGASVIRHTGSCPFCWMYSTIIQIWVRNDFCSYQSGSRGARRVSLYTCVLAYLLQHNHTTIVVSDHAIATGFCPIGPVHLVSESVHVTHDPIKALCSKLTFPSLSHLRNLLLAFVLLAMHLKSCSILLFPAFGLTLLVNAQSGTPPSSWPQVYPGMPTSDYSPEWQACACKYIHLQHLLPNLPATRRLPSD